MILLLPVLFLSGLGDPVRILMGWFDGMVYMVTGRGILSVPKTMR